MKDKYLWYTDTHLDQLLLPWKLPTLISHIIREKPKGLFLTGDISTGLLTTWHLSLLARFTKIPIYFTLGNHDYHFTSIAKVHARVRALCKKHPNLIWLTDAGVIPLNDEVALIGTEGWYDAQLGNPKWLRGTFDWFLTEEFRKLPNMDARIAAFRKLSVRSCDIIAAKLQQALDLGYKTIYILTHFPPWKEATRDIGTFLEPYYLAYNVNHGMGQTIEKIMQGRNNRHVMVLAGHTHSDCWIHVQRNIECKVNRAKYYGFIRNEECLFI